MAQLKVAQTHPGIIEWLKTAVYWIVAVLNILAFSNIGADGTEPIQL